MPDLYVVAFNFLHISKSRFELISSISSSEDFFLGVLISKTEIKYSIKDRFRSINFSQFFSRINLISFQ